MEKARLKKFYNLCNPYTTFEPDSPYNVDVDRFGIGDRTVNVRGKVWAESLADQISFSDDPVTLFFSGHRGSGKTTELKRMMRQLEREENFLCVYVNSDEVLDLADEIEVTDVLSVIAYRVIEAVARHLGDDPDKALNDGFFKRLWHWLRDTDVELSKMQVDTDVGRMIFDVKNSRTFREQIRRTLTAHLTRFKQEVAEELRRQETRIVPDKAGIVVIVDQLEKLRGVTANWDNVLASAERMFCTGAVHLRLPVHSVYTVPPALVNKMAQIEFLPVLKVRDTYDAPYADGIAVAEAILRARFNDDGALEEIFGETCEAKLHAIIKFSGGFVRDMLIIMRKVLLSQRFPVTDPMLTSIFSETYNEFRGFITEAEFDWLAEVERDRFLTLAEPAQIQIADRMLGLHAVLRYQNDALWYRLHPAVRQIPQIAERLRDTV